ncbi:Uncharacterised protein [uncultured archaeon]|nr:Uncharacterised protein [uncultured archaeon]
MDDGDASMANAAGYTATTTIVTEESLYGLPDPVQRYLREIHLVGKETVADADAKQIGTLRDTVKQGWQRFTSKQNFKTDHASFTRSLTLHNFLIFSVLNKDEFRESHGFRSTSLLGFIPLARKSGTEMDQTELLLYLAETVWFPSFWLSNQVHWQMIDDTSARLTVRSGGVTASVLLHFGEEGKLKMTADGYYSNGKKYGLEEWSAIATDYKDFDGVALPTKLEFSWDLEKGNFAYFRCELADLKYNVSRA